MLFFHGNGGNISHRGDSIAIFHRLGLNVLIIDYRGYGMSGGFPTEEGVYEDARSAWHYLIDQGGIDQDGIDQGGFKHEKIIIFGRSIGSAVATTLAAEVGPQRLILESAFSSARDMADTVMP